MQLYAPPKALVSDPVDERALRHKPLQVRRAATMLWGAWAIGVVNLLFQPGMTRPVGWIGWLILAAIFAFLILLTASISAGHNWARITFLVLFLIGVLPYLGLVRQIFAASALFGLLSLVQQLLQVTAMFLVFTPPGSLWFRKRAQ